MHHPLLTLTRTATPEAAIALQQELRSLVVMENDFGEVKTVAGVDVGFAEDDRVACAAIAVLRFPDLTLQESVMIHRPTTFPHVPGLLAFREVPVVMEALAELKTKPDLLLCDGNGYIHPRRCGFACHLGIVSGLPSIGVAKTPYLGEHEPLAEQRGAWQPIRDDGEVIGAIVRTQSNIKPVYVSVGHRISLNSAIEFVLKCAPKYRLPETTRQADQLSKGHTKPVSAI
jgi:deoxyribonuclease V